MKHFLADHSYDMVKLMLNQIAIAIFGFSLVLASGKNDNEALRLWSSIGSIVFYLFLVYVTSWDIGYRDHASVKFGTQPYRPYQGFLIGLCANAVNYLLAILIALAAIPGAPGALTSVGGVAQAITIFVEGMYSGVLTVEVGGTLLNRLWFVYFLTPLPGILMTGIAYICGVKDLKGTSFFNKQPYPDSDRAPKQKKDGEHHD